MFKSNAKSMPTNHTRSRSIHRFLKSEIFNLVKRNIRIGNQKISIWQSEISKLGKSDKFNLLMINTEIGIW